VLLQHYHQQRRVPPHHAAPCSARALADTYHGHGHNCATNQYDLHRSAPAKFLIELFQNGTVGHIFWQAVWGGGRLAT
jgi:hypothetical protein